MKTATRKIVKIDADKCNGCGQCVPNCAEGAIRMIDGKARLVADNLCDGLGNCLGKCPMDAITIEERPAGEFDEAAVENHLHAAKPAAAHSGGCPGAVLRALGGAAGGGCPGSAMRKMAPKAAAVAGEPASSQLGHWPVQLALAPVSGPIWQDADVLISADCVAYALADFHTRLLAGKTLAIACPKLDDVGPYIDKLTEIFANNSIRSLTIAHMEVPCCGGIVYAVGQALAASGRQDIPVHDITVGVDGTIRREV